MVCNTLCTQDAVYCVQTGWKQQLRCVEALTGENQSYLDAETKSYMRFQTCPISFDSFVRFEALMFVCFIVSFIFVTRKKRKLLHEQRMRLASC